MAQKTISGSRAKKGQKSNGCNPKHNNRDYLPSNADPERQHLNIFFAESTKSVTIEQIYDKLFQASYEEWLRKEHDKGRQKNAPEKYIEKIRNSPEAKNQKREQYEIIWQLGDMKNTGWETNQLDFMRARQLLADFAEHLLSQPDICVVTAENIANPAWKPPFDNGLVITNFALHGDEKSPHIQMDFIPYSRTAKRGQRVQNAYAAAFEGMGYKVEDVHAVNPETGELLYKQDTHGNFVLDKKGEKIPVKQKISFGSIDWIEEQKGWLQREMLERHGWEREYKGKNQFGDVTMSRFAAEDNLRQAAKAALDAVFQNRLADAEEERAVRAHEEVEALEDKISALNDQLAAGREELEAICKIKTMAERDQVASEAQSEIDQLQTAFDLVNDFVVAGNEEIAYGGFNLKNLFADFAFEWERAWQRVTALVDSIKEKIRNIGIFELVKKVRPENQIAPVLQENLNEKLAGASSRSSAGSIHQNPDYDLAETK